MASADVLRRTAGADHTAAHMSQLFRDMHISYADDARSRPHRQEQAHVPAPFAGAALAPAAPAAGASHAAALQARPTALALDAIGKSLPELPDLPRTGAPAAALPPHGHPGSAAAAAAAPPRPCSPDTRYVVTDWASQDDVDGDLSVLLARGAALTDGRADGAHTANWTYIA
mmetsp:Transcript_5935/g.20211  ORF Transcript_5935/g.20211 Transcript_5935/m.20211 type:complete len:172 (+) Transcript_5935:504-1019(+)